MSLTTQNRLISGPHKRKPRYLHVTIGLAVVVFLIYLLLLCMPTGLTFVSILIFNFLFLFLIFPLEGPLWCKILLLVLGDTVGLTWNFIQSFLMVAIVPYLGEDGFKVVGFFIEPAIGLLWMVSVWSLGLSALASTEHRKIRKEGG